MNNRSLGLLLILILGVGAASYFAALYVSAREQPPAPRIETLKGLIGSEKEAFFKDERVVQALRRHGLEVVIELAGSREMATRFDLDGYDFTFPGGAPAAEKIRRRQGVNQSYDVFFTTMAIASWRPIADLLVANGYATKQNGYYTFAMDTYLEAVANGVRWRDLAHNDIYNVDKPFLINSTDIRKSNSAAMYLALASYIANGEAIVQNDREAQQILSLMESLFWQQGFLEYSSGALFEDYLAMGMGQAPLVMIYEAQFIAQAAIADGGIQPDMVLMYPEPTIFTEHILVPLREGGARLGELLKNDPELIQLEIEHGFRNNASARFRDYVQEHNLPVPDTIVNVIEPPSYEMLEGTILCLELSLCSPSP